MRTRRSRAALRLQRWDRRKARNAGTAVLLRARAWTRRRLGLASRSPVTAWSRPHPYRKLFVVGCPRSGTTWITSMLQQHPQVLGTEESHAYSTVTGPFIERGLRGDAGWRRVLTRYDLMASRSWGVGLHRWIDRRALCRLIVMARARRLPSDLAAAQQVIAWCFDDFFVRRGGGPTDVLVEKTPQHLFYAERILDDCPAARIIEVVRDGRDVCVSMEAMSRRHFWAPADRRRQLEIWLRYITAGSALQARSDLEGRVLRVHYEAMREAPVQELRRVLAFAGVECPRDLAERMVTATAFERYDRTGPGRPRRKGIAGDWRNHFTTADVALFESMAGPIARQLGYANERP